MTRFSSDEKFKRPHMIQYLPSGKLMIEDSVDSENATRVSKFDKYGKKLTEKKLSNMINMSLFQYEDELDKTFDIAQSGYMNLQISVTDTKKNKIKGISNVDFLSEITEYGRGVCLLVLTKKRWVYFLIREYPEDRSHYKDEESICKDTRYYVLRVDPVNDTSEAIKLQPGTERCRQIQQI